MPLFKWLITHIIYKINRRQNCSVSACHRTRFVSINLIKKNKINKNKLTAAEQLNPLKQMPDQDHKIVSDVNARHETFLFATFSSVK